MSSAARVQEEGNFYVMIVLKNTLSKNETDSTPTGRFDETHQNSGTNRLKIVPTRIVPFKVENNKHFGSHEAVLNNIFADAAHSY